jgi:hypothetical protein
MRWAGDVACGQEMRNEYQIVLGKSEGNRPLGILQHKWDLRQIEWEGVDWMHLTQERDQWWALVNTIMYLCVP